MINPKHLQNIDNDRIKFLNNSPFHHIVLDNFLDIDMMNLLNEIKNIEPSYYDCNEHDQVQIKKQGLSDSSKFPPFLKKVVAFFQSEEMISYLEQLTDILFLLPDPELYGGGIHKTNKNGHLAIHADFNLHPHSYQHRRLNVLLYLNPIWKDEWNGHLELWNKNMTECEHKIAPIMNRVVIFRITDDAYHGHPIPLNVPDDISRYSLAFYYYTKERPHDEKNPFHWAVWKKRYNQYF